VDQYRVLLLVDWDSTWAVEWDGVSVEEIGHHDEIAIGCELVGLDDA